MLGVVSYVVIVVLTAAVFFYLDIDSSIYFLFLAAVTGIFVLLLLPGFIVENYYDVKSEYEDVLNKIDWIDRHPDESSEARESLSYEDIRKLNDDIRVGRGKCKNFWYGVFVNDKYLELEEIPMPEWLSPYPQ